MDEIQFPTEITVTDQVIDCRAMSEAKKAFAVEFTKNILAQYSSFHKERVSLGIAGPSGSGKSFLSVLAEELGKQIDPSIAIIPVSIDAFHFPNTYLENTQKDGTSLKEVKGRYDTYDVGELTLNLEKYTQTSAVVHFPEYSRKIHEPVQNIIRVDHKPTILLLEGLWLLYEGSGWGNVVPLLDYTFFIDDSEDESRARTLKRHVVGGRSEADAALYYETSDIKNRELVLTTRSKANQLLIWPK